MTGPTLPLDGVTTQPARARCPGCTRDVALTATGRIAPHGYTRGPVNFTGCPMAGLTPTQASARLTERTRR